MRQQGAEELWLSRRKRQAAAENPVKTRKISQKAATARGKKKLIFFFTLWFSYVASGKERPLGALGLPARGLSLPHKLVMGLAPLDGSGDGG